MGGMMEWLEHVAKACESVERHQLESWLSSRLKGVVSFDGTKVCNMITNAGINAIVSALCNVNRANSRLVKPIFQIEQFGASTSVTAPNKNDTTLGGSVSYRMCEQVDSVGKKMVVSNFIGQPEFNFNWKKVGLFLSTGQLFCIAQVNEAKTSQVAKTVLWEIEFTG
jgi:hypothetical protein